MAQRRAAVVTRVRFAAAPETVWDSLLLYEQVVERPPLLLRLLLPVPIRSDGRSSEVGDEVRCLYEGGHLRKRLTEIDRRRRFQFEVVEQDLAIGAGVRLAGGGYRIRALPGGRTEVAVETWYASPMRPRCLWRPIEAIVCHLFHRHLLRSMRRRIEPR